jgi:aspartokinase
MHTDTKIKIGGIVESHDMILVSVHSAPDQPGTAGRVLSLLGNAGVNIEFVTEGCNIDGCADISFCFHKSFKTTVRRLFNQLRDSVNAQGEKWQDDMLLIGIFGPHFREKPALAAKMCSAFGTAGINIYGISTSISTISCVISGQDRKQARQILEQTFALPE